ncbi:restriction endonuclease subunit S, partial [Pseudomonadales bacterium]|nr:restriction endonuclease subunit S [Pseudomonadales bacterium]
MWEAVALGAISDISYGYTAKASFEQGSFKFLRITDIQDHGVDWSLVPYCEVEADKIDKFLLNVGDIVFARTGATTGKSYLLSDVENSVFASYL